MNAATKKYTEQQGVQEKDKGNDEGQKLLHYKFEWIRYYIILQKKANKQEDGSELSLCK